MNKTERLGVNIFSGFYPEAVRTKPKGLENIFNWFELQIHFNPLILGYSRHRFLKVIKRQRRLISAMDNSTWNNTLLQTRNQLMRYGFKIKLVGRLLVLLERICQSHWQENLSAEVAWAAFLMVKGCGVEINKPIEMERAMLLCACTVALTGVQVHWIVADEQRATTLVTKNRSLSQILGIELLATAQDIDKSRGYANTILIITAECLVRNYLQDAKILATNQRRLGLLLKKLDSSNYLNSQLQMTGLCFALVENIDFWLLEKAFTTVDNGNQQLTLYELFHRYQRCAGTILSLQSLDKTLWDNYKVAVITLSNRDVAKHCKVSFRRSSEQKWRAIATKLIRTHQSGSKICLIVTTSESLQNLHNISTEFQLPMIMVKEMRGEVTFAAGNILVLGEPFPWFGLAHWLNDSDCQLVIADFCDSLRVLHYLECMRSPTISVEIFCSLEDKWLQHIEAPSLHNWLKRLLFWRKAITGNLGNWLLRKLLIKAEIKRENLYNEMSRWLGQREKMYSFFR